MDGEKMEENIIEFKSDPEFFDPEESGLKNNTSRFTTDWDTQRQNDFINAERIKITNTKTGVYFIRQIRHRCKNNQLAIITWEP